jgi:predicted HAD superfamily phosphohydrolase YqeG
MAISQNTPVVIGDTLSTSIKTAHVRKMTKVSKAAGLSLSGILDRAIGFWLEVEAPVYLEHAKRKA